MASKSIQAPGSVVIIRPHRFHPNPETASDNAFQRIDTKRTTRQAAEDAYREVSEAAVKLEKSGILVHIFEDHGEKETPDSVFPNNWFSTHPGGHVAVYPMYSPSRRRERRYDILEMLKAEYRVQDIIDYSCLEYDGLFLEGTGAMVLDHIDRVAYTARSNRANAIALERFCTHFNFEPMAFDATDTNGHLVYHTNVMMCIGTDFAMVGFDMINDKARRDEIYSRLQGVGRDMVELSNHQIEEFAGNAIELFTGTRRILVISSRAVAALTPGQKKTIEKSVEIVPISIPTIELAGGSIRCMLAGIHLSRR
ncbi:citrulline utilization hydrolase CtlX [uncultured Desulfuromusa sp.]|uniref:citrulline utilization hydrolase CtlX n=1 Tax=uncultured Desulfuromusa sp. TaxID=219183 RepID=UPI002AA80F26|nr:arginine deiminase-related protein [uncultured Desulfuromusa sp.]